ncbi:putative ureidoglycolate hydrolase, partial [Trifolium pratense]
MKQTEFVRQKLPCYTLAGKAMQPGKQTQEQFIGVIRGSEGEWLIGFSKLIGRGDVYIAELRGLPEGLKLAKRMNFNKVEVHVDSIGIVNDITHKKNKILCGKALVDKICRMMELDWEVIVKHTYREANQLADALYIMHLQNCPLKFSSIAHHANVTQCLGAVGGNVWYLGVAKPSVVDSNEIKDDSGKTIVKS